MNTLFTKTGSIVPARPTMDDDTVKAAIIFQAMDDLFAVRGQGFRQDDRLMLIDSLMKHWEEEVDVYELAKDFEKDGWKVNFDFVSKLENVSGYVDAALKAHIDEWAEVHDIALPYAIGTQLDVGVITGVWEYYPATYKVLECGESPESTRRLLIKFEDAKLANGEDC
ncbi:hypothetical protein VP758_001548 [Vibrio harveyi]|nr:hypothetical protein [Vibrio harveyi]